MHFQAALRVHFRGSAEEFQHDSLVFSSHIHVQLQEQNEIKGRTEKSFKRGGRSLGTCKSFKDLVFFL